MDDAQLRQQVFAALQGIAPEVEPATLRGVESQGMLLAASDAEGNLALVTPDRALARRVLSALARWNIPVDDSDDDGE